MTYLFDEIGRYDEEDWSLWEVLQDTINHWHDVYSDYWGLHRSSEESPFSPEAQKFIGQLNEVAPKLLQHALALRIVSTEPNDIDSAPWPSDLIAAVRRILEVYGESNVVRDRWSFGVAHDAVSRLRDSSARIGDLLTVTLIHQLDERTSAYLARVARLYAYGFDVEVLAMARSALQTALEDAIPDEKMKEGGFKMAGREYPLATRIAAAARFGYFNVEQKALAHELRKASNDALHTAPVFMEESVPDSLTALKTMAGLLEALSQDPGV